MRVNEHGYSLDDALGSVGPGWEAIIRELWAHKSDKIVVVQVKEKFGGLRVYYNETIDELKPISEFEIALDAAEDTAERTCETCGAPGEIVENSRGWLKCGCPLHRD